MRRNSAGNATPTEREPTESDADAFARLFRDAYRKCFAAPFTAPLSESESHRLSVDIAESTGLEIGWKSLKNYSQFLLGRASRAENPSLPTLDTLARYVAGAPPIDEARRRTRERHYPYWVRYREALRKTEPQDTIEAPADPPKTAEDVPPDQARHHSGSDEAGPVLASSLGRRRIVLGAVALAVALVLALLVALRHDDDRSAFFADEFDDLSTEALAARGWSVHRVDSAHWAKRGVRPGHLTLFTLEGDNWPQAGRAPAIDNLLVRRLPSDCFVADVRFTSFVPRQNWHQAGLLLLEDTAFAGRSARLSLGYNDFSGGFPQTREIIVQAITSLGRSFDKPEEFVHQRLFVVDSATERLVRHNLASSALRIEKRGSRLRLLSSTGPMKNAAFREVGSTTFEFRPAYVAVFAMKGFVGASDDLPVHVDAFSLSELPCAR